ncbi:hypothetical protein BH23VER1_BH23VER1_02340 [soil metagenome]
MNSLTRQYWKIGVALLAIFLCGQGLGYVVASLVDRNRAPSASGAPLASPSPEPGGWADEALARLRDDLGLSSAQEEALRPVLARTGDRVVQQRERALFQIHLQLLAAHDEMGSALNPDQQAKLLASRDALRRRIDERFAAFLHDGGPGELD